MKLCAFYCVWGDFDLLEHSIKNLPISTDDIFIVYSNTSNFGEVIDPPMNFFGCGSLNFEPNLNLSPAENERNKRNFALSKAKELGYTHFINLDGDELYDHSEFLKEKERFQDENLLGLVCRTKVYFRSPTLTTGYDTTLVPFIHKITPDLRFTWNTSYPFAFTGPKREIRIDPTRQLNINKGVEWSEITMHHMSWVRSDVQKKVRNSTARSNIEQSSIIHDYVSAKAGYYCEFYKATIEACENVFNIPEIIDHELIRTHQTKELS